MHQPQVVADGAAAAVDGTESDRREVGRVRSAAGSAGRLTSAAYVDVTAARRWTVPGWRRWTEHGAGLAAGRSSKARQRNHGAATVPSLRPHHRRPHRTTAVHCSLVTQA